MTRTVFWGNSLAVQWLGVHAFTAEGPGSIPGLGTKILRATQCSQKKERKKEKKSILIKFLIKNFRIDLEIIILSEVSQTEKEKYHMISLTCRIENMIQMNIFTKQKHTHRLRKQTYGYQRGEGMGRDKLGVWD